MNTVAFTAVRNWEFIRPLFFGDTVCVETTCLEKIPAGRRNGKVVWQRQLINQSEQIVQQGSFETLVAIKKVVRKPNFKDPSESRASLFANDRDAFGREDAER